MLYTLYKTTATTCKTQVRRSHVFFFPILAACFFQASQIQNKTHCKIGCFPFENCQWQLEHHFPEFPQEEYHLARYTEIFRAFLLEISISFFSRKFRNYRNCVVCFSEIQQFRDFLKTFPRKFSYHLPRFRNFRNFLMATTLSMSDFFVLSFTKTSKNLSLLFSPPTTL